MDKNLYRFQSMVRAIEQSSFDEKTTSCLLLEHIYSIAIFHVQLKKHTSLCNILVHAGLSKTEIHNQIFNKSY